MLNPPLAPAALLVPGGAGVVLAGALLRHVGACSGDTALANWTRRRRTVFTCDDVAARMGYFFVPRERSTDAATG